MCSYNDRIQLGIVYVTRPFSHICTSVMALDLCLSLVSALSVLDKLLGQLGIYATWLSSGYPQSLLAKTIAYFHIFFYATFFSVITHFHIA